MQRYIRKFIHNFKEYIVLIFFLIISLSFLPLNNSQKLIKIKKYAFASFAYVNNVADNFLNLFVNDEELLRLRKENAELNLRNNLLRNFALENSELHKLLNFKNHSSYDLIPSRVITKSLSKTQTIFIINSGLNDSLQVGMPVINDEGLVGIVDIVADKFSIVKTLHNTSFKISIEDQRSNFNGILGYNGGELFIENVPSSAEISIGDRIVTSSFGTLFPPYISVGVVSKKNDTVPGLVGRVTVIPFVDLNKIKNVFVMRIVVSKELNDVELNFRRGWK